jgi:predicted Na+-dependent transporter
MDEMLQMIARVGILAGVFTSMLAIGLSTPLGQIVASLRHGRLMALTLLANFVAIPLLALALARLLPLQTEAKTALVLLGAAAGAPLLPRLAQLARGHVPFAIGLMVVQMVLSVVYVPLVLPLLLPEVKVSPAQIATSLLVIMLLPLALALLARERYPQVQTWSTELSRIAGAGMAIGLTAGVLVEWRELAATIGSGILVGSALLALGAMAIGWLFAAGVDPAQRRVAALGDAMRNFSAALLVAGQDFGPATLVMTMVGTIALTIILVIAAGEFGRSSAAGPSSLLSPPSG